MYDATFLLRYVAVSGGGTYDDAVFENDDSGVTPPHSFEVLRQCTREWNKQLPSGG
jgi:hypothetical protein